RDRILDLADTAEGSVVDIGGAAFAVVRQRGEFGGLVEHLLNDDHAGFFLAVEVRAGELETHLTRRALIALLAKELDDRIRPLARFDPLDNAIGGQRLFGDARIINDVVNCHWEIPEVKVGDYPHCMPFYALVPIGADVIITLMNDNSRLKHYL